MSIQALTKYAAGAAIAFNLMAAPAIAVATDSLTSDSTSTVTTQLSEKWSLAVDPLIPLPLLLALGGVYGGLCLYRRQPGTLARLLAGGTIALVLLNPQKIDEQHENLPTEIVVAVDKTASQKIGDRTETTEDIYNALMQELNGIDGLNIRVVEVDGLEDGQNADGTALFTQLNKTLGTIQRDRLGGIFMLTDGQVHDVPLPETWKNDNVPLHALISGRDNERDRRIVIEQSPRFGLLDSLQTIRFRVADEGQLSITGEKVDVTLHYNGEEIARHAVVPGEATEMQVNISGVGKNLFELRTGVVEGELTEANNAITTNIEGIRENLNVLLLSGQPGMGTRLYRDLFKSDPDTNLVHLTIMRPPEKEDATPLRDMALTPLPTREIFTERLDDFDLIVFDNYQRRGLLPLPYFNRLNNYVLNGGSLLVVSGDEYSGTRSLYKTPLSKVLPVSPTGTTEQTPFLPSISATGDRHPVTRSLGKIPYTGRWGNLVGSTVLSGDTLMQGNGNAPLMVLDRKGQGRVAMLMSDHLWLWDKGYEGGGPSSELLRGVSHWLLKDPAFEEEALRIRKDGNNLIVERQTLSDSTDPVTVTAPSGEKVTVSLSDNGSGVWQATLPITESGIYSANQARTGETPLVAFSDANTTSAKEMADTVSTTAKLEPITELTGGYNARMINTSGTITLPSIRTLSDNDGEQSYSGNGWAGIRMNTQTVLNGIEQKPLLPNWLMLLSLIGSVALYSAREGDNRALRKLVNRLSPFNRKGKEGINAPAP